MTEFVGTTELANAVRSAMHRGAISRGPGNAAEIPNERTIRYYLSEGMIPPPFGKKGVQLRFGRLHLLTILAIKKLQELGITGNAGIKQILDGKDEADLEKFLEEDVNVKTVIDPDEIVRFQQMSASELEQEFGEPVQRVDLTGTNPATEYFSQKLFPRQDEQDRQILFSRAPPAPASSPRVSYRRSHPPSPAWHRHEIADGVELHIRSDVDLSPRRSSRELLAKLKRILGL